MAKYIVIAIITIFLAEMFYVTWVVTRGGKHGRRQL